MGGDFYFGLLEIEKKNTVLYQTVNGTPMKSDCNVRNASLII